MNPIELYLAQLTDEGYRPKLDDDGDIIFKAEGKPYYLQISADDLQFVRLAAYGVWTIESPAELEVAYRVTSAISARFKAAKAFVAEDENVHVTLEVLVPSPEAFGGLFPRLLSILQSAARELGDDMRQQMEELVPEAQA